MGIPSINNATCVLLLDWVFCVLSLGPTPSNLTKLDLLSWRLLMGSRSSGLLAQSVAGLLAQMRDEMPVRRVDHDAAVKL